MKAQYPHGSTNLPNLIGERVSLRLGDAEDIPEIIRFYQANHEHLSPFEPKRDASFYSDVFWKPQMEKRVSEYQSDQSMMLFIFKKDSSMQIIGSVNATKIARGFFQACVLGYNIAKDHEGQGYVTESLKLAINHLFEVKNLHRIMANYLPENQRSARVLERLGFEKEGLAKDYLFINGQWRDHVLTSLINENWEMPISAS